MESSTVNDGRNWHSRSSSAVRSVADLSKCLDIINTRYLILVLFFYMEVPIVPYVYAVTQHKLNEDSVA